MTFGRLGCVMLDWFYCCLFPVGNSWHCSLFSIDIHFQQYCFLLDSCTVWAKQTEYLLGWPQSLQINKHKNKQNMHFEDQVLSNASFKIIIFKCTVNCRLKDVTLPLLFAHFIYLLSHIEHGKRGGCIHYLGEVKRNLIFHV